ncbi:MAG: CRTAC1 family protein, partial [Planctomycetales bacterium]
MPDVNPSHRKGALGTTQVAALALVALMYLLARQPTVLVSERRELAARFQFAKVGLPVESLARGDLLSGRSVHPSLERISSWISATGAAATLGDLDRDGLPNDLCLVDPRVDQVVILPVPGTGDRYSPFVLDAVPLPYTPGKMAPTGTLIGDFNEDGAPDVLVHYWGRTPVLFLRKTHDPSAATRETLTGTQFEPRELLPSNADEPAPARWFTHAATQADIDGDGHLDLLIGNFFQDGADILNRDGTGVASVMHAGKAKAMNGGGAKLFLWAEASAGPTPTVTYVNHTAVFESLFGKGWVLACGAADLDRDSLPEIYLAHDFGPDRLLHNRSTPGNPQFALAEGRRTLTTPKSFMLGKDSFKGMGVAFGDVNGDGWVDIYVSNIADQWALQESHMLWLSTGETELFQQGIAPYVQSSEPLGLSRSGWGWDCKFADFDNDGALEAIQATGFIQGKVNRWPELQALGTSNDLIIHDPRFWPRFQPGADLSGDNVNPFYVMGPDRRFVDIAAELGLGQPQNTRGLAVADVDGDGRVDFVAANQWSPSFYYHNESLRVGEFLGLHLLLPLEPCDSDEVRILSGHPSLSVTGRPAIGAQGTVRRSGRPDQMAQVDGGTGHSGRQSPDLHFGLGDDLKDQMLAVDLHWRDGFGKLHSQTISLGP